MYIEDKTLWLVNPDVLDVHTPKGLHLLDTKRVKYCDMAILCAAVWLLIKWTPAGITVKEIVALLEMVVPIRRPILVSETCKAVAEMASEGWVRSKSPIYDRSKTNIDWSKDQIECTAIPMQTTQRLVSFSGDSRERKHGAILLNIREGRCYSLNDLAAQVWQSIERMPGGLSVEDIVDTLRSHFKVAAEYLRRAASDCVEELERESLVAKKPDTDPLAFTTSLSLAHGVRVFEFGRQSAKRSIANQPFVQRLGTLQSFLDQLFPQGAQNNVDWRAKKLKEAIDNAPDKAIESLGHVCSQLQLSLSHRQARRIFKEAAGISMKDYARKRRLVLAAIELHDTAQAVKLIASNAGYRSYDGFWKAFHDMFLLTPVEFRTFWQRCSAAA